MPTRFVRHIFVVVVQDSKSSAPNISEGMAIRTRWGLVMEAEHHSQGHHAVFSPWIRSREQKRCIAMWTENIELLNPEFGFCQGGPPLLAT